MSTQEEVQFSRRSVVAEAKTWLRTPWHHNSRVKGAGTDCGQLLIAVYHDTGIIPDIHTGHYVSDWALNRKTERYLEFVKQYATEIAGPPLPGDIVMFKYGHCFSHGGIVVEWPLIIEARRDARMVTLTDVLKDQALLWEGQPGAETPRQRIYFTLWP